MATISSNAAVLSRYSRSTVSRRCAHTVDSGATKVSRMAAIGTAMGKAIAKAPKVHAEGARGIRSPARADVGA